ncbi:FadR/GntR family transcriptional regulator [Marivita sp.]|uniref:FadR/GntR family transcriptional regulator n=1 Tax=Marivita sp. TaxID=2003365 RepID=UPI0025BDA10E|nr:FadR/GntR family transcriptional regulator [Marivita sp.]
MQAPDPNITADTPARPTRLEDRVFAGILDDIRLGKFTLGEKLPSESELASQYGCSRPVIRSALAKLRENGLIVSRQGAGSFVSSGHDDRTSGYGALESISDIAGYFAFRKTVEAESVARAAMNVKPADIDRLKALVEKIEDLIAEGKPTVEVDIEFHNLIADLSDNRFLHETLVMLEPSWLFVGKFVRSLGRTGYRLGGKHMNSEHKTILAALEARDPKAARAAMIAHIDGSERRVFKGEK